MHPAPRSVSRRNFLATSAAAAATSLIVPSTVTAATPPAAPAKRKSVQLAISSYSYWHFRSAKVSIETVIEKTAALGVAGVDVLHRQMEIPERAPLTSEHRAYLQKLKRHAFRHGVNLICLSIHQDFVDPSADFRRKEIEHTIKCIEIAAALGIPCIRLNSGRWNTIPNFNDLMKARGEEPVLPGHTEDEGFKWCQDAIEQCLPKAEECGVLLALENH